MMSLVGFLMVVAIIALLLKGKMSPIVVLIIIPLIAGLLVGTPVAELGEMVKDGISTVSNNSVLFIFSIIFFGVMSDLGVFDVVVNWLVKKAGNNSSNRNNRNNSPLRWSYSNNSIGYDSINVSNI